MEGIPELVQRLRGMGVVLGLGTGNLERGARVKLERAGLNGYFAFGGYGSDSEDRVELLKAGRSRAEKHCGTPISASDVFVVGDTERDILAAKRAEFKVIAIATGNVPASVLQGYAPDFFFPDFRNTDAFLEALNGRAEAHI